jgi:hypothetical protein
MDSLFFLISFFAGGFIGFLISFALAEDMALDRERAAEARIDKISKMSIGANLKQKGIGNE